MSDTTGESMVKRLAAAVKAELRRQRVIWEDEEDWDELMISVGERIDLAAMLRAVLRTLHEPTPEMIQAGALGDPLGCDIDPENYELFYGRIWRFMLHAAEKEN